MALAASPTAPAPWMVSTGVLDQVFLRVFYGFSLGILGVFYGFSMDFLWGF